MLRVKEQVKDWRGGGNSNFNKHWLRTKVNVIASLNARRPTLEAVDTRMLLYCESNNSKVQLLKWSVSEMAFTTLTEMR